MNATEDNLSQEQNPSSLHPVVRRRMTAEDWDDAADLFEQGAVQAELSSSATHSAAAREYAVKRMNSLAMFATGKAMAERERTKSPNVVLGERSTDSTKHK